MSKLVAKFGGLSLSSAQALSQIAQIILTAHTEWEQVVVVVSAIEGVTDQLIETIHDAEISDKRAYRRKVAHIRTRHLAIMEELPLLKTEYSTLQSELDRLFNELIAQLEGFGKLDTALQPSKREAIRALGERLSARLVAALLRHHQIRSVAMDANHFIRTNNQFMNATINLNATQQLVEENLSPLLERNITPVITGFMGADEHGNITTLGRIGTDYTATAIAYAVQADQVTLWLDTPGILSAPQSVPHAQPIQELTYGEASDLALLGNHPLHPKTILPARLANIPLHIQNIHLPHLIGTIVQPSNAEPTPARMRAVVEMSAIEILIPNTQHLVEVIPQIGSLFFATFQVLPSVLMSLQGSFRSKIYVGVPATLGLSATEQLTDVLEKRMTDAKELTRVSVLTLIGANVQQCVPCLKKALHALEGLPLRFINTNSSHDSLSVVVAPQDRHEALTRLHALLNAEITTDFNQ